MADSDTKQESSPLELLETASEEAYRAYKETGEMPEGLDPAVELLAKQKKMTRDTQSAYTKTNQQLIAEKARASKLMKHALEVKPILSAAQQEELDDLKYTDPDAYIEKLTAYNKAAKQAKEKTITQELQTQTQEEILEHRKQILKQFKATTGVDITEDVMLNDVPPRITRELEQGEISFEEYLEKVGRFLQSDKVVANAASSENFVKKKFSKIGGQTTVTKATEAADVLEQYASGALDI